MRHEALLRRLDNEAKRQREIMRTKTVTRSQPLPTKEGEISHLDSIEQQVTMADRIKSSMKHINKDRHLERTEYLERMRNHTVEMPKETKEKSLTLKIYDNMRKMQIETNTKDFLKDRKKPHIHSALVVTQTGNAMELFNASSGRDDMLIILDENDKVIGSPVSMQEIMEHFQTDAPQEAIDIGYAANGRMSVPETIYKISEKDPGVLEFSKGCDYSVGKDGRTNMAFFGYDETGEYQETEAVMEFDGSIHEEVWERTETIEKSGDEHEEDEMVHEFGVTWG